VCCGALCVWHKCTAVDAAAAVVVVAAATTTRAHALRRAAAHTFPHHIIKTLADIVAAAVQPILNIYNLHITMHCILAKALQMM